MHGPVWAVTDLAEERFSQIQVPRIFGRDRANYLARQLSARFPDTPFCTALPLPGRGTLMDRLAPARQLLLGVDASERVHAALDGVTVPLAGLWSSSMLLAQIAGRRRLAPDLFVVLPQDGSLRILFLKDHQPLLSRLAPSTDSPVDRAAQIARTLRHLQNTRSIERSERRYPVLLLGAENGLGAALAAQRLDLIASPGAWASRPPGDWRFLLFELALRSPPGQLAPIGLRSAYLSRRLNRLAYGTAAASLVLALGAASGEWERGLHARQLRDRYAREVGSLRAERVRTESAIASFGAEPDQLRAALNLDAREVVAVPALAQAMRTASGVVARQPGLRVERMNWRLLLPSESACAAQAPAPSKEAAQGDPQVARDRSLRRVELKLELKLDGDSASGAGLRRLAGVAQGFAGAAGACCWTRCKTWRSRH